MSIYYLGPSRVLYEALPHCYHCKLKVGRGTMCLHLNSYEDRCGHQHHLVACLGRVYEEGEPTRSELEKCTFRSNRVGDSQVPVDLIRSS